jgi:integrase
MAYSIRRATVSKPSKPRPDFPLFPHNNGLWCKKVRGKLHYFGAWSDPQAALDKWLDQKDDLLSGRVPRSKTDKNALTLETLVNRYLATKKGQVETAEIAEVSFWAIFESCENLVEHFGADRRVDDIRPEDFEAYKAVMAAKWGPKTIAVEISRTRSLFKYGLDVGLYDRPVRYGPGFKGIGKKAARRLNGSRPTKMYEAVEVRHILAAASVPMRAMTLMAINTGFGNHDLSSLPQSALNLQSGWVDFARTKTGIERRCPLWPETIAALREAIAKRPKPADPADNGLVFLTQRGQRWVRMTPNRVEGRPPKAYDGISLLFCDLLKSLDLKRPGRNFYALRHTFRTVADEALDQVAAGAIMGHVDNSMAGIYRQRIDDKRLSAVSDHVHEWLFGTEGGAK